MPINFSKPPRAVLQASASELRSSLPERAPADGSDAGGAPGLTAQALPLYSVPLKTLARSGEDALHHAKRQGWRMIMEEAGSRKLVDHINRVGVASVSGGKALENLLKAGEVAAAAVDKTVSYEPRVLEFGRIGQSALWLHNPDPNVADRFFTTAAEPQEISEQALMTDVRDRARDRVARQSKLSLKYAAVAGDTADDVGG